MLLSDLLVELLLDDIENGRVSAHKGREILGLHNERIDRLQCDDRGRMRADLQYGGFTDQLPGTAVRDNALPPVVLTQTFTWPRRITTT